MNKKIYLGLVAIIILFTAEAFFWTFNKKDGSFKKNNQDISNNQLSSDLKNKEEDGAIKLQSPPQETISNWITYKNEKYKYSIQYPSSWYRDGDSENDLFCYDSEDFPYYAKEGRCSGAIILLSNYPNPSKYYESRSASKNTEPLDYPKDFEQVYGELFKTNLALEDFTDIQTEERGIADWDIKNQTIILNNAKGIKQIAAKDNRIITSYFLKYTNLSYANIFYLSYNDNDTLLDKIISTIKINE
jgi:hypothetical protein